MIDLGIAINVSHLKYFTRVEPNPNLNLGGVSATYSTLTLMGKCNLMYFARVEPDPKPNLGEESAT